MEFGSEICGDLRLADQREWLLTNGRGDYACGTVSGSLTRSYHGLLVAALHPPVDRTLLVSKVEEEVAYGGTTFRLTTNRWEGGRVDPHGHRLLQSFALEGTVPRWRYGCADALLEKRIWMQPGATTTCVSYRLLRSSGPLQLSLRIHVQRRSHHGDSRHPVLRIQPIEAGVRVLPEAGGGAVDLLSDHGLCRPADPPVWSQALLLSAEAGRGLACTTEHLHAATIEASLSALHPSLTFIATTEPDSQGPAPAALGRRQAHEQHLIQCWRAAQPDLAARAPAWIEQLVLAADQFLVDRPLAIAGGDPLPGSSVIAGYPWFNDWGRDALISLPGLTLVTGRERIGERILRSFAHHLQHGLVPNRFPDQAAGLPDAACYNTVDATLWFVQALREQHRATANDQLVADLFPRLERIIEHHRAGTLFSIRMDPADGLLSAGEGESQLTWMDARPGDRAITPRHGKPVEVNALWLNALFSMAGFARLLGRDAAGYEAMADSARAAFQRYWNPDLGCCFDVLDGPDGVPDASLRPNQLLALSLPERLLSHHQELSLLRICAQRLLTPHGLRSLDPADPRYRGRYGGDVHQRDGAYHQGTVWAWWLGPFARAHARLHGDPALALSFLSPMAHHLSTAGLGSISEIFDGDPPFQPRGCIAQAWSVAEVLRSWVEISRLLPPAGA